MTRHTKNKLHSSYLVNCFLGILPVNVLPRLELGADALKNCWRKTSAKGEYSVLSHKFPDVHSKYFLVSISNQTMYIIIFPRHLTS